MSQLSAADAQTILVSNYVAISQLALCVYEYAMTFDQEIAAVWRRKRTAASLLLLSSRWIMILGQAVIFTPGISWTSCRASFILQDFTFAGGQVVMTLFSALRVHAILLQDRGTYAIPMIVVILGTVPLATNLFGWIRSEIEYVRNLRMKQSQGASSIVLLLTRISAIALDAIVLAATWTKSFQHFREMRRVNLKSSVTNVLLRDGTLYFASLLAINIIQILTFSNNLFFVTPSNRAKILKVLTMYT
ncbi:hypothetical protein PsYK624_125550 [Phanerochaete sordida]|uniref:DUF6533 domain-containing protein n=1 Tax=Phanerochaete sordida TaxID=48140 RepID=A0A9P3GMU7_9APHY|nr:hypothetical protein PsYK624_125550 [Phanerochaete sordida]